MQQLCQHCLTGEETRVMGPGASQSACPSLQQTALQVKRLSSKRDHNGQHGHSSPALWLGTPDLVSARPTGTPWWSPLPMKHPTPTPSLATVRKAWQSLGEPPSNMADAFILCDF